MGRRGRVGGMRGRQGQGTCMLRFASRCCGGQGLLQQGRRQPPGCGTIARPSAARSHAAHRGASELPGHRGWRLRARTAVVCSSRVCPVWACPGRRKHLGPSVCAPSRAGASAWRRKRVVSRRHRRRSVRDSNATTCRRSRMRRARPRESQPALLDVQSFREPKPA